jgi:molybdopterin-biosynthesis enzyme MoeA-like protein
VNRPHSAAMNDISPPTACLLIIGDEILSGRTQDANLKFFAERLGAMGIRLREARVIPDVPDVIVETVNTCRALYTYVFTTGGIGPTHDDITTVCVARAFGRNVMRHPVAVEKLVAFYGGMPNEARLKMAETPDGPDVELIETSVTAAPGFRIGNVYVMAGIPSIARAMFDAVAPTLRTSAPVLSNHVDAEIREGDIAAELTAIQERYPTVTIGSYPTMRDGKPWVSVVARATDKVAIMAVVNDVAAALRAKGHAPTIGTLL